jgi:hypothetical protein
VRAFFYVTMAVVATAVLLPPSCRRMREHVLLSLVRESERPVEVASTDPLRLRFPPTAVRVIAIIDYQDAADGGHLSFVPPDGSGRYAWAIGVCATWASACLDARPPVTLSALTYGEMPSGLEQIEPSGGRAPRELEPRRLYGLALFGEKLFALTAMYRDERGVHLMPGSRFAEAIVAGRREEIRAFLAPP